MKLLTDKQLELSTNTCRAAIKFGETLPALFAVWAEMSDEAKNLIKVSIAQCLKDGTDNGSAIEQENGRDGTGRYNGIFFLEEVLKLDLDHYRRL